MRPDWEWGKGLRLQSWQACRLCGGLFESLKTRLEAIRRGREMPLSEGLAYEATLFGLCASTQDMKEGMTAFLEKRPAKFTGH